MKVRRALFTAQDAKENEIPRHAPMEAKRAAVMDSLAFLQQSPAKPKPKQEPKSFSILEQLDLLDMNVKQLHTKRPIKNVKPSLDRLVVDSLACTAGIENKKVGNQKSKRIQVKGKVPKETKGKTKIDVKRKERTTTQQTNMGVFEALASPVSQQQSDEEEEAVHGDILSNLFGKATKRVTQFRGALRRAASSPLLSPSLKTSLKRENRQDTPSPHASKMQCSPISLTEPPIQVDQADVNSPLMEDAQDSIDSVAAEHDMMSMPARTMANKCFDKAAVPKQPIGQRGRPKKQQEEVAPVLDYLVPERASPDLIIDPVSLKRMEKQAETERLLSLEIDLNEALSVSTCTLSYALGWDDDVEEDSNMAVASPVPEENIQINANAVGDVIPECEGRFPTTKPSQSDQTKVLKVKKVKSKARCGRPKKDESRGATRKESKTHEVESNSSRPKRNRIQTNHYAPETAKNNKEYREERMESDHKVEKPRKTKGSRNKRDNERKDLTHRGTKQQDVPQSKHAETKDKKKAASPAERDKAHANGYISDSSPEPNDAESSGPLQRVSVRERIPTDRFIPYTSQNDDFKQTGGLKQTKKEPLKREKKEPDKQEMVYEGWSRMQITQLQQAHATANPTSSTFWDDVAEHVEGKDASECCNRWMGMFPTPAKANARTKKETLDRLSSTEAVDDLFEATPWRGKDAQIRLPEGLDLGSAIKIDEPAYASDNVDTASDEDSTEAQWQPRPGMSRYIQDMRRRTRCPPKQKKGPTTDSNVNNRSTQLRERIDANGVDMDVRMTPGGTLNFNCRRDDNDDDFFDEYYGDGDEDDGELYAGF